MPRASRRPIDKNLDHELRENFASLISSLQNSYEIEGFLNDFLTKEEKIMLGKRLMLENNYPTSNIETSLKVSRETVRVHKNIWQNAGSIYKEIISKISKKERTRQLFNKIESMLKPLDLAMRARSDMRARAKLVSGDFSEES